MQDNIEAMYGTDEWSAKVLDLLTKSLTVGTYSKYDEGKVCLFADICIDEDGVSPLECTGATWVRYFAWIAERGTIGAGSLQHYLSAINTFRRHTGRSL
eukprot:jgi/Tetstr1/454887/TSEL_041751.t1